MAVSSWHAEWCGDVTVNTRIGLLNNTSLYEVHAIVNLKNDSTSKSDSSDETARTVIITHGPCIGIQQTVLIFNHDFQEINHTLQFESDVISLHVSESAKYLLIGELSGLMSLICLQTGNTIFCMNVLEQYGGDLVYCAVSFEPATSNNTVTIFIAATTKWVRFRLILNDSSQNEAEKDHSEESSQDYVIEDDMGQMTDCTFAALYRCANSSLLVVYDDDHMILINDTSLNDWAPSYIPMPDGILKVQATYDGKYLLVLDTLYCLNVICINTCTIINRWTEMEILEFVLLETVDHANAVVDCKLIMVLGGEIHSLKICGFPNMNKLFEYSLKPPSCVTFVGALVNEDTVHVVESKTENGECKVLNILGIYETLPANKLIRLLSKKRIDEAENFANFFGLSNLGVAKARVGMILESLSASDSYGNTTELCETLKKNLDQIEDIPYVVNICCKCPMLTLEHQKDILQYLIGRIMKNDGPVADAELAKTVFDKLKKLETYEMLFQTCSTSYSLAWEIFSDADLWQEFLKNIKKGKLSTATLLLERHVLEQELCQNHINKLLKQIPETLLSHDLLPWLCHCVPLILRKVPDSFSSIVQWVIQKSCNMEINEKASWPRNALQFFEGFIALCDQLLSDLGIDKCNIYFCFAQDSDSSLLIEKCREILCNLKDLEVLRSKYNCKISLGDYSESDKKIVAFRLLDWIAPEMLKTFISQFLCQKHNLDVNEIITDYIKDYMMNTEYCWWYWEEAPWEELMKQLVACINIDEMKCTAIHEILKQAPVPWSDGIQMLLNTAMDLSSEKCKVQLREEVRIMGLKTVILKYGFRNHSISDGINAEIFVNYILTQDQPTAVDDALKVVAAHCHLHVHDLYVFRMKQLTTLKRETDFVSIVKSFDETIAQICCNRFIVYVVKLLNNEPDPVSDESREEQALFVNAAILILRRNRGLDFHLSSLLEIFVKLKKLQAEFGIFLSVESYTSEELRREMLRKNVTAHLRNEEFTTNPTARICQILTNKGLSVPKQVTGNLYRLGDILGFSCDVVSAEILQLAVTLQKFDTATETCREIIQYFPSIENAKVPWNAIHDILLNSDQNLNDVNLSASLLCLMQVVLAYCNCDMIPECLELTVLMRHACVLQKHLTRSEFSLPMMPLEYFEWSYTDIFKEMGLSLDAMSVVNFLHHSLQFYKEKDNQCSDLLTNTRIFCERLKQFGHSLLAFSTSCYSIARCALYAATALTDEASCHVTAHLEAKYSHQTELVSEMICKIFTGQVADVHLAYALLCSLPQVDAMNMLALQETRCSYNFNKLCALGSLGMQLSDALRMPTKVLYYQQLWKKAVWSTKLQGYNISLEGFDFNDDDAALEDMLVQIGFVSPTMIKSYCHCFNVEMNKALLRFLEVLLTSCLQDTETKMIALKGQMQSENLCDVLIKMAKLTISMMTVDQCQLHDKLCSILPNIDSYNYEFLEFVLQTICSIGELANVARSCQVLRFLKVYQRISAPSQYEIHEWQNRYPSWHLTSLANSRLPFHPITSENIWKVLRFELTADTISVWLGVSNILTLPNDEMLMIAGQNLIDMVSKCQKPNKDYLDELTSIVARMENKEKALALITSMSTKFRPGIDKVQVAKLAVLFAFKWSEGTNEQAAKKALKSLSEQRQHFTTEHILHKYNLTKENYLSLIQYPQKLIIRLYEDCPVGGGHFFCWIGNPDVHNACQEIGQNCKLDLRQIRFALAEKWLRNTESSKMLTSANFEPDLTQMTTTVNDSLKRAVYIFKNGPIEESVQFLNGKTAINSPENTAYKVRALTCLLAIADPVTVQNMCGKTVDDMRAMFKLYVFAAEMERLHLPCAITYLNENYVTDILASLWRSHSHVNLAVSLMAQMLLHYKISTVKIWDVILPRLVEMKLWDMLIRVVVELSSYLDIIVLPSYKSAWNFVLFSPFDKVAEEQFNIYVKVFSALHMCPHSVQLDLHNLANSFVRAGLSSLALDCILHIGNVETRTKILQVFFNTVSARSVMDNWWELKSSGVYIHHADKITEALYSWIDHNDQYLSIADSHLYMEALATYTLGKGSIQHLVRFALQYNRCDDGIKLVRKYLELNPQSKPAAMASLSDLELLKAFAEEI